MLLKTNNTYQRVAVAAQPYLAVAAADALCV
jgi:hypothetical protein